MDGIMEQNFKKTVKNRSDEDIEPKNSFLVFKSDVPFRDKLLAKDVIVNDDNTIALPTTDHMADAVNGVANEYDNGIAHGVIAKHFGSNVAEVKKYLIKASTTPKIEAVKDHYAIIDAPFDMEKDLIKNKNVMKSNKGTYYTKIPKSHHDAYQSHLGYDANGKRIKIEATYNRGNNLILQSIGLDPYKTNNGKMRITVQQTYTPEQIKKMKGS